jgi:transposase-like protein
MTTGTRGTRSKYNDKTREICIAAAKAAGTDAEIAKAAGVSQMTFRNWINRYPDFKEAIQQARSPIGQAETLSKIERRKELAERWIDTCLENMGVPKIEDSITYVDELGRERTKKTTTGSAIDWRLIDRVLGISTEPEKFTLEILVAEIPEDPDEEEEED